MSYKDVFNKMVNQSRMKAKSVEQQLSGNYSELTDHSQEKNTELTRTKQEISVSSALSIPASQVLEIHTKTDSGYVEEADIIYLSPLLLDDYPNDPFKAYSDEALSNMIDSIKTHGGSVNSYAQKRKEPFGKQEINRQ